MSIHGICLLEKNWHKTPAINLLTIVMASLYSRRAYTSGLILAAGTSCLISLDSRMLCGDLAWVQHSDERKDREHSHSTCMIAGRKAIATIKNCYFSRSKSLVFY